MPIKRAENHSLKLLRRCLWRGLGIQLSSAYTNRVGNPQPSSILTKRLHFCSRHSDFSSATFVASQQRIAYISRVTHIPAPLIERLGLRVHTSEIVASGTEFPTTHGSNICEAITSPSSGYLSTQCLAAFTIARYGLPFALSETRHTLKWTRNPP